MFSKFIRNKILNIIIIELLFFEQFNTGLIILNKINI